MMIINKITRFSQRFLSTPSSPFLSAFSRFPRPSFTTSSSCIYGLQAVQGIRRFGDYPQPPLSQGPGAKADVIPDDFDQATGREREELKAFAEGDEYFNRKPVQMEKGQGSFENPVMVPSEMKDRIVGMVPKGMEQPIWFEITDKGVYYVPELDLHFKLFNPYKIDMTTLKDFAERVKNEKREGGTLENPFPLNAATFEKVGEIEHEGQPVWKETSKKGVFYVSAIDLHFTLDAPAQSE